MPENFPTDARLGVFTIADASQTTKTLMPGNLSSVDGLPGTRELIDTSKIGDSGRTFTRSIWNGTAVLEGFYVGSTNSTGAYTVLESLLDNTTAVGWRYAPLGTDCGESPVRRNSFGDGWIRSLTITGRVANAVTFRAELQVEGVVNNGDSTDYAL